MSAALLDRLKSGPPVLLDGATGTELARRGVDLSHPSWTARILLDDPRTLLAVHRDYRKAGAEIITANTFRTHACNLRSLGREGEARDLTMHAVQLVRKAVGEDGWIAGSVAPLEDCYSPQLTPADQHLLEEHRQMAGHLLEAGVDLILIETQVTIREARCAAQAAAVTGVPFAVCFVSDAAGRLLSGETLRDAFSAVAPFNPVLVGVNCLPAEDALPALATAGDAAEGIPRAVYANTGRLIPGGTWVQTAGRDPAVYAGFARDWRNAGIRLIGGCCGTQPAHISAVKSMLCGELTPAGNGPKPA